MEREEERCLSAAITWSTSSPIMSTWDKKEDREKDTTSGEEAAENNKNKNYEKVEKKKETEEVSAIAKR